MIPTPIKAMIISEEKPVDGGVAMYEENLAHEKEVATSFLGPGSCLP